MKILFEAACFVLCLFYSANLPGTPTSSSQPSPKARVVHKKKSRKPAQKDDDDMKHTVKELSESMEKVEAELDIIKEESRMLIQRQTLGFNNRFYLKTGISVISPRQRTFTQSTDAGLGLWVGLGQYFGRNHVLDLSFEWDLYPAVSLRYRYEFHLENPQITWGPVVGYKIKVAPARPLDNFMDNPDEIRSSFWFAGLLLGFPLTNSLVAVELLYMSNQQTFIFANAGLHFFF